MGKEGKIYIIITVVLIGLLVFIEYTKPKEISWFPSYSKNHTIPLGMKVLHTEMKSIFKDRFEDTSIAPYSFLKEQYPEGTYFFVNETVKFGKEELNSLLAWVAEGNQLFIASSSYEKRLLDTLNLKTDYITDLGTLTSSYKLSLMNETFKNQKTAFFDRNMTIPFFKNGDSLQTTAIGTIKLEGEAKNYVNVIKQPFGKGELILSLFPESLSNYFILKSPNEEYVSGLLSYLTSSKTIYFDNHYKTGSKYYSSPMYVFLNNKALKWAYYLVLIATFFYIIFEGRRKQRSIPIMEPLKNQTLDFVRTIANMYYEKNDHRDIASYKINHFLAFIRNQQSASVSELNTRQIKDIASRNGKNFEETKKLFDFIKTIQHKISISKEELMNLNQMIEDFKK
ncbi:DUF4350 domain-containing protein [Ascidiimonas sp. W6]|uniref:DUF4350 domain-containing protein n=1 Tax=Ascidiimonas meishanensis TaxID=3128903 RepID=UPI0030EDF1C5